MAEPIIRKVDVAEINGDSKPQIDEKDTEGQIATIQDAVSKKKQSISDIFTIICAGFALISDGYQNSLM
jgi:hypothetical protein